MRLNTVDLPDPMPPTKATVSPSAIENDNPSRTVCSCV